MPKVLVVDDSLSVRKVVEKALEGRDLEVLSAATGREAIERIERDRPDLVVCDVLLPDHDGYQICHFVRTHPAVAHIPVLLISGVVNSTVLARAAEVRSSDVMFKPFAADELVRKIDLLLAARAGDRNGTATVGVEALPPAPPRGPLEAVDPAPARALGPSPPPPSPASDDPVRDRLRALVASADARFAALVDREGFLIEAAGELVAEAEVAGALASCLAESSDGIGLELGLGAPLGLILEFERGILLVQALAGAAGRAEPESRPSRTPPALLAVAIADAAALGKVRYAVKKAIPDLERAL